MQFKEKEIRAMLKDEEEWMFAATNVDRPDLATIHKKRLKVLVSVCNIHNVQLDEGLHEQVNQIG